MTVVRSRETSGVDGRFLVPDCEPCFEEMRAEGYIAPAYVE